METTRTRDTGRGKRKREKERERACDKDESEIMVSDQSGTMVSEMGFFCLA